MKLQHNKLSGITLLCLSLISPWVQALDHSGTCSGTFLAVDNPHVLVGSCTVPENETLTLETGVDIEGNLTLFIDGSLNADGVTINVRLNYRDGSDGTVQNSEFSGSNSISVSGSSTQNPATPLITANNFDQMSTAISVSGTAQPTISNNTMTVTSTAISMSGTAQPTISNNTITTNSSGLVYSGSAAGSATENDIGFTLAGSSGRTGISVSSSASPLIDNNTINDDLAAADKAIDIGAINAASTVILSNNSLCTTGSDVPFVLGPGFFGNALNASITGTNLICDTPNSIDLATGTFASDSTLRPVESINVFNLASTLTAATGVTLTIPAGITLTGSFRSINVDGILNVDGATFNGVRLSYRNGSDGTVQNTIFTGNGSISISGSSILNPVSPLITANSFDGISTGISVFGTAQPTISNNTMTVTSTAISISGTAEPMISNNTITTNSSGLTYSDSAAGSATGNDIGFTLGGSIGRRAISVSFSASPLIDNNTISDDPDAADKAIDIGGIIAASTVTISNNTICTTGNDVPFVVGPGFFDNAMNVSITATNLICDTPTSIEITTGTFASDSTLKPIEGISTFSLEQGNPRIVASGITLTIPAGITLTGSRSINISGILNADGAIFNGIRLNFQDNSDGTVQNSVFTGSASIYVSSFSSLNPVAPLITENSFNGVSTGIFVSGTGTAQPTISNNTINSTNTGILISGASQPTINNNTITANNLGLSYSGSSAGTVSGNNIGYTLGGGSSRRGINVSASASPLIDNNTISDDPAGTDKAIDISAINAASTVIISNNNICTTGGDVPFVLGPGYFGNGMNASISGNNLVCDTPNSIEIATGTFASDSTLQPFNGINSFYLGSQVQLTVANGITLTIPAGITLNGSNRSINIDGSLNADGAIFNGIRLGFRNGSNGTVQNTEFTGFGNILMSGSSTLILSNNLFDEILSSAVFLSGSATLLADANIFRNNLSVFSISSPDVSLTLTNNLFERNGVSFSYSDANTLFSVPPDFSLGNELIGRITENIIRLPSSFNASGTLPALPIPYTCSSNVTILTGETVIMEPGASIQCGSNASITVNGELIAVGTPQSPILFTAIDAKSGNRWGGLVINDKQSPLNTSILKNCIVEFSGNSPGLKLDNASLPIRNCVFRDNNRNGLELVNGSSPILDNNAFIQNLNHGILTNSGSDPDINHSSIFGNGVNGVHNDDDTLIINAVGNYWGDDSGPRDSPVDSRCGTLSNPDGIGEEVSDCVNYDPWIRIGPSVEGTMTAISGGNQTGTVGEVLADPIVIEVLSTLGTPLQGIEVIFSVVQGDAAVIDTIPAVTDVNGQAAVVIQLGDTPGEILIAATARDINSPLATFLGEANAPCLFTMKALVATEIPELATPDSLQATIKGRKVRLYWDSVFAAEYYQVYRAEALEGPYALIRETESAKFKDKHLMSGVTYWYRVQAVSGELRSAFSAEVEILVTLQNSGKKPRFKINQAEWDKQQNLLVIKGNNAAQTAHVVLRDEYASVLGMTHTNENGKWKFALVMEHSPCFVQIEIDGEVKVKRVAGASNRCRTRYKSLQEDKDNNDVLKAPSDLIAHAKRKKVLLKWSRVPDAESYHIYRSDDPLEPYLLIGSVSPRIFTDRELAANSVYYYKVQAIGENEVSELSEAVEAVVSDRRNRRKSRRRR